MRKHMFHTRLRDVLGEIIYQSLDERVAILIYMLKEGEDSGLEMKERKTVNVKILSGGEKKM